MILSKYKYNYRRNLSVSFIISIMIITSVFLFSPSPSQKTKAVKTVNEYFIPVDIIPVTFQLNPKLSSTQNKDGTELSLPGKTVYNNDSQTEPGEIVPDETLDFMSIASDNLKNVGETVFGKSNKLFTARQILEVIPQKDYGLSGTVKLSLLIGIEGKVIEHIIVVNTMKCEGCLENVLSAVYGSRWQPLVVSGKKKEFWTEKLYEFN